MEGRTAYSFHKEQGHHQLREAHVAQKMAVSVVHT